MWTAVQRYEKEHARKSGEALNKGEVYVKLSGAQKYVGKITKGPVPASAVKAGDRGK